mgnify:CR=1 FL=1
MTWLHSPSVPVSAAAVQNEAVLALMYGSESALLRAQLRGSEAQLVALLLRDRLREGFRFDGPAIVEEQSATTVMPPGWTLTVDSKGNLLLQKGASA